MKKGTVIAVLLMLLFLFSCVKEEYHFKYLKTITLEETFPTSRNGQGICIDHTLNKDVLYIGNFGSLKRINFYDLETGNKLYTVRLDEAAKVWERGIGNMQVIGPDSILLFEKSNIPEIIMINRKGDLVFHTNIEAAQTKEDTIIYDYRLPYMNMVVDAHKLFMFSTFAGSVNSGPLYAKEYFKKALDYPYLSKIYNYWSQDELKIERGLDSFPRIFMTPDKAGPLAAANFKLIDGNLFLWHEFNDNMFVIDTATLRISKKIKVQTDYSKIGQSLFPVENYQEAVKKNNASLATPGRIISIFRDKGTDLYLVQVFHEMTGDSPLFDISFLIYNNLFENIGELKYNQDDLIASGQLYQFKDIFYCFKEGENARSLELYTFEK